MDPVLKPSSVPVFTYEVIPSSLSGYVRVNVIDIAVSYEFQILSFADLVKSAFPPWVKAKHGGRLWHRHDVRRRIYSGPQGQLGIRPVQRREAHWQLHRRVSSSES